MPDLVAAAMDFRDDVGPAFGGPAWHEERRRDAIAIEEVQDERHTDLGAIGALRHHAEPGEGGGVARAPGRLGGGVEGGARGGPLPGGACYRWSHGWTRPVSVCSPPSPRE